MALSGPTEGPAVSAGDSSRLSDALAESRQQFRALSEAIPHLVWTALADGSIDYFNRRWQEYTGYDTARLQAVAIPEIVHPDERSATMERWKAALATGTPYEMEYRLRNAVDGTYRWFIARAVPIRDEHGAVIRWIGTATDIERQKRANANLRFVIDASAALSIPSDVEAICDRLARIAVDAVADWCIVVLRDDDDAYTVTSLAHRDPVLLHDVSAYRDRYSPRAGDELDRVVRNNEPLLIATISPERLRQSAHDAEHLALLERLRFHSAMVVPLSDQMGAVYGAITLVTSDSVRTFNEDDLQVVSMVANQAGAALRKAKTYEAERHAAGRLRFIAKASELVFQSMNMQRTFDSLTSFLVSEMADFACILLLEGDDALRAASLAHHDPAKAHLTARLAGERLLRPPAEERLLKVLAGGTATLYRSFASDSLAHFVWDYRGADIASLALHSAIVVPLQSRGETYGALLAGWGDSNREYQSADLPVFEDLGRRLSIAVVHARTLERERKISAALQQALLPQPGMLPALPGLTFEAEYRPSSRESQVGGDWYDALTLPDGRIAISVGDVAGRGLHAAGLMGKLRQALNTVVLYEPDPARALDAVDFILRRRGSTSFATAFLGLIDLQRQTIRYASAGHPPPLLRRNGALVELESVGLPLGLREDDRQETREASLVNAELLLLYTDGLVEGTRDIAFGTQRLQEVAGADAVLHVSNAAKFVCDACLPSDIADDTAVLSLRFGHRTHWSFDAEDARAAHDARNEFMAYLHATADEGSEFDAAELVFGELVGNVVRHAPGPIDVQVDWHGEVATLHVIDRGKGFVRNPQLPADPLSESGRGLFIISALARTLRVERIAGYGNHVAAQISVRSRVSP